jgi:phage tail sheath protein FI
MPIPVSYPGVYVQEVSSGVHTITGVATSITAFVGRALRGPLDTDGPDGVVTVNSFADFQRIYGGVWSGSPLSFAVRDFFLNGGATAIVVRVYSAGSDPAVSTLHLPAGGGTLDLVAAKPGSWGNALQARVDHDVSDTSNPHLFNLFVRDGNTGQIEEFRNVSTDPAAARAVDKVLAATSSLVRTKAPLVGPPGTVPDANDPPSAAHPSWGTDTGNKTNTRVDLTTAADVASDGKDLTAADIIAPGLIGPKQGIYALEHADLFNLLCVPPFTLADAELVDAAVYCQSRRAVLLVDPPTTWASVSDATKSGSGFPDLAGGFGDAGRYAAAYFPRLRQPDPTRDNQLGDFPPCGALAGVIARTDAQRGVWKAPAGLDASVLGAPALSVPLTDAENGQLNPLGLNCLRSFPLAGRVVWGARTLRGADRLTDDWKYLPVRRTALYLEESLYRGTQWVVFEPNDEPLWAQIRLNVGAFMQSLFRQHAFQGSTPKEAYFVKCDKETTTQNDINSGVVNVIVGFAPLKPAEFVVITIQQMAGQITT